MRRPRLPAVVLLLTLFVPSFAMPAYELPPRPPGLNHMNMTPDGGVVPGYVAFLFMSLMYGWGLVPNVAFVVGLVALAKRRDFVAALAGGLATLGGLSFLWPTLRLFDGLRWGYFVWLASLILLAVAAPFLAWVGDVERPRALDGIVEESSSGAFPRTDPEGLPGSSP